MSRPTDDSLPPVAIMAAKRFTEVVDAGVMKTLELSAFGNSGITLAGDGATNNLAKPGGAREL